MKNKIHFLSSFVITTLIAFTLGAAKENAADIEVRNAHAMAYDSTRDRVILFGGANESKVCSDTWEWDGKTWNQVSSAGPSARTFPAMTYDSRRKKVVLFGGNRVLFGKEPDKNTFLSDTWEWDGHTWIQINALGPPPRAEAAMAFDSSRGKVVLFGGHNLVETGRNRLGDTWEWDGTTWSEQKVNGPSPRNGAAQVYDSARRKIILFGGATKEGPSGETWEWNGVQWTENRVGATQGRFNCAMAYDEKRQKLIRFGGRFAGKPVGDTWEYDGKKWKQLSLIGPESRNHTSMVYNSTAKKIILFGGHDFGTLEKTRIFGDTWEWDGTKWTKKHSVDSKFRIENDH